MAAKQKKCFSKSAAALIADYEWLRRVLAYLEMQSELLDRRLVELERLLPEGYVYPGDQFGAAGIVAYRKKIPPVKGLF